MTNKSEFDGIVQGGLRHLNPLNDWRNHVAEDGTTMASFKLSDENIEALWQTSLACAGEEWYARFNKSFGEIEPSDIRNLVIEYLTETTDDMERFTDNILAKSIKIATVDKKENWGTPQEDIVKLAAVLDFVDYFKAGKAEISMEDLRQLQNNANIPDSWGEMLRRNAGTLAKRGTDVLGDALFGKTKEDRDTAKSTLSEAGQTVGRGVRTGADLIQEGARLLNQRDALGRTGADKIREVAGTYGHAAGSTASTAAKETVGGLRGTKQPNVTVGSTSDKKTTVGAEQGQKKSSPPGSPGPGNSGGGQKKTTPPPAGDSGETFTSSPPAGGGKTAVPPKQKVTAPRFKNVNKEPQPAANPISSLPSPTIIDRRAPRFSKGSLEDLFMKGFINGDLNTHTVESEEE